MEMISTLSSRESRTPSPAPFLSRDLMTTQLLRRRMLFVTDLGLSRTLLKIRLSFQEPELSKLQLMSILSNGPEVEKFLEKPSLVSFASQKLSLSFHAPLL